MKPPVVGDERPKLWTTGAIFTSMGLLLAIVDHPLVPLTYVFHLIPVAIGGAVATAILRERFGRLWIAAQVLLILWLAFATIADQTSVAPVFIASGVFSLVRAIMKTVDS
jgi:hypothetical protein